MLQVFTSEFISTSEVSSNILSFESLENSSSSWMEVLEFLRKLDHFVLKEIEPLALF